MNEFYFTISCSNEYCHAEFNLDDNDDQCPYCFRGRYYLELDEDYCYES